MAAAVLLPVDFMQGGSPAVPRRTPFPVRV